jgi:hypothetical protein
MVIQSDRAGNFYQSDFPAGFYHTFMNEFIEPEFDFSQLSAVSLQQLGNVTFNELIFVYKNRRSRIYDMPELPKSLAYHFCIGLSSKSRFLFIALNYKNGKFCFLDVKLANENEIEEFWCGGKK